MSNEEKLDDSSASQLNLYTKSKAASSEKIPKNTESQPVIINFYSGTSSRKSDKVVQTDQFPIRQIERKLQKYPPFLAGSNTSTSDLNLENPEEEDSNVLVKNTSETCTADDTTETGLMEHRKHNEKHGTIYRVQTDLERKKLEAELKAAEEIAKIRQTVIEKRLAVELAALNDDATAQHKLPKSQTAPLDMDDLAMRKSLMDSNLAQDMDNLDFQTRFVSSRTSPPASSRIVNQSATGLATYRPPPEPRYDPRDRSLTEQRYDPRERSLQEQRYEVRPHSRKDERATMERHYRHEREYPFPPEPPIKTQSIWRTAFAKIKRKMKPKASHEDKWND